MHPSGTRQLRILGVIDKLGSGDYLYGPGRMWLRAHLDPTPDAGRRGRRAVLATSGTNRLASEWR